MPKSSQPTVSEILADRIGRSRPRDLSAQAVEAAKIFILDTIGVGLAGARTPESRSLVETAREWGGRGPASVWGRNVSLPAWAAAMANSHQAHCLEFDCVHEPAVIHPMTVVLPCAIADIQARAARGDCTSGEQLLTAAAAGSRDSRRSRDRHHHRPALLPTRHQRIMGRGGGGVMAERHDIRQ